MADLSVAGRIYRASGELTPGVLHIDTATGTFESIARSKTLDDHIDAGDMAIVPGAIDTHVHFRDPGLTHKEDWNSGSVSAAFGGVTTVIDMPNTAPPTTTMSSLKAKLAAAAEKSVIDYAAWCGATWFLDDLPEMLRYSPGVKIYLGASTGDLLMDEPDRVVKVLDICRKAGKPVVVHAEAQRILDQMRATEGRLEDHDTCRPPLAEVEAIYDLMKMQRGKDKPLIHVAHAASVDAVQAATSAGFSVGVCPHHLLLDVAECCHEKPTHGKMNPPLRDPGARAALWDAFAAGTVPILESDHAPHTLAEKSDTFHGAPAGVPGVETMVPLLLARAMAGDIPLQTVIDTSSKGPAAMLGAKDRGSIAVGMRADLAIYDLDTTREVDPGELHSKARWSPFEGMPAIFPTHVISGGRRIVDDGELVAEAGSGRPLLPLPES